jgi:hypothetical protein
MRRARRVISRAARRLKVSSRIRAGGTPASDEVGHAVRQGHGLAGAGAGDDEHGARATPRPSGRGSPNVTARRWASLRPSRVAAGSMGRTIAEGKVGDPSG